MIESTDVQLNIRGAVAWIRLNRPGRLNAFSQSLLDGFNEALDVIDSTSDVRVVIVTGNGRAFSAGGDLVEFRDRVESGDHEGLVSFINYTATTLTRLEENPRPVIGAVNGVAVAGGLELMLCCDIVLAAETAEIGDGHQRYGVVPGAGGSARLVQKVPRNVASRLLLTGDLLPASRFVGWGLIDEVMPASQLEDRANAVALTMAALSPLALGKVKRTARDAATQPTAVGLKLELEAFASYVGSTDFAEGMNAFSDKRAPRFTGH